MKQNKATIHQFNIICFAIHTMIRMQLFLTVATVMINLNLYIPRFKQFEYQ